MKLEDTKISEFQETVYYPGPVEDPARYRILVNDHELKRTNRRPFSLRVVNTNIASNHYLSNDLFDGNQRDRNQQRTRVSNESRKTTK